MARARDQKDYTRYSFWLETAGESLTPRPSLDGSLDVDVGILGAGFTGLWTAYALLQREPSLRVAIIEQEIAGFGASGRNGAWCTSEFPLSPAVLARRYGGIAARQMQLALYDTVDEVGRTAAREDIDAQFVKGGELTVARGPQHLPALQETYAEFAALGLKDRYKLLNAGETAERIRGVGAAGGLYSPHTAVLHPGRLVRGLAHAVERRGATLYEGTEVRDIVTGASPRLLTARGEVRARTVVLAGEAYASRLHVWRRRSIPLYSLIVLTEPLSDTQWSVVGWEGRECVASPRYTVDYLSRTADGRILFGGRGAPYHFRSSIADSFDRHEQTHAMLRRMLLSWFPSLAGIRFTHAWGGPLAMPRDWMPCVRYDARAGLAVAGGYTGQGVAMSNLAGRILADLITERVTEITTLPVVGHLPPRWEPEPLRWLAVRYLQHSLMRIDDRAEASGRPPSGRALAERFARH